MHFSFERRGFVLDFFLPPLLEKFVEKLHLDVPALLDFDAWFSRLPVLLDENHDRVPDLKFGEHFQVIFYEIIELKKKKTIRIRDDVRYRESRVIAEGLEDVASRFLFHYRILMKDHLVVR